MCSWFYLNAGLLECPEKIEDIGIALGTLFCQRPENSLLDMRRNGGVDLTRRNNRL